MSNTHHLTVEYESRIDRYLAQVFPDYSRSFWQKKCEQGLVMRNHKTMHPSSQVKVGDELQVIIPTQPDFSQKTLPIIYEDDDILVVDKPAGLLTHAKGALSDEFSVAEFMRSRTTDGLTTNRPGIVHRLDRGTSGVMVAAKHTEAKHWLQKQFSQRKTKKTYLALVNGHLKEPSAMLQLPLERNPKKPQTFRVHANGKPAQTTYKTLQSFTKTTFVELHPLTGRTHQLRVHMAYLGNPIVGDTLYGGGSKKLSRFFLHAASLEFTLPSKERRVFEAPLPEALQQFIQAQA